MEEFITDLLKQKELTKTEFCRRYGTDKQHFKEVAKCIWLQKLEKIAKALDMEPPTFLSLYYKDKKKKTKKS